MAMTQSNRSSRPARPSKLFTIEAQQLMRVGRIRQAVEVCKRGLVYYPLHVTGYVLLAQAYRELGQTDRAVNVLRDGFRRTGAIQLDQLRALLSGEVVESIPDDEGRTEPTSDDTSAGASAITADLESNGASDAHRDLSPNGAMPREIEQIAYEIDAGEIAEGFSGVHEQTLEAPENLVSTESNETVPAPVAEVGGTSAEAVVIERDKEPIAGSGDVQEAASQPEELKTVVWEEPGPVEAAAGTAEIVAEPIAAAEEIDDAESESHLREEAEIEAAAELESFAEIDMMSEIEAIADIAQIPHPSNIEHGVAAASGEAEGEAGPAEGSTPLPQIDHAGEAIASPVEPSSPATAPHRTAEARSPLTLIHEGGEHGHRRSGQPGMLIGSEALLERDRTLSLASHAGHNRSRLRSSNLRLIPGLEFAPLRHEDQVRRQPIAPLINEPMPELTRAVRIGVGRPHHPESIPLPESELPVQSSEVEVSIEGVARQGVIHSDSRVSAYIDDVDAARGSGESGSDEPRDSVEPLVHDEPRASAEGHVRVESSSWEKQQERRSTERASEEAQGIPPVVAEIAAEEKRSEGLTPLEELARRLEKARIPVVEEPVTRESSGRAFEPTIVSETLADILLTQGAFQEALKAFRTLARTRADRLEYFQEKIHDIERRIEEQLGT